MRAQGKASVKNCDKGIVRDLFLGDKEILFQQLTADCRIPGSRVVYHLSIAQNSIQKQHFGAKSAVLFIAFNLPLWRAAYESVQDFILFWSFERQRRLYLL